MFLKKIRLVNFRNFANWQTQFAPLTIFYGKNGVGKTNLLEAIAILSFFHTYRGRRQYEIIAFGQDFCKITGEIFKEKKRKYSLEFVQTHEEKRIKINQVAKKLSKNIGFFKTVSFWPESLQIISGAPILRRRFYNLLLCQEDFSYTAALIEYSKIVVARNKILWQIAKNQSPADQLLFWDQQLVQYGQEIIAKRQNLTKFLNNILPKTYQDITATSQILKIEYRTSVAADKYQQILNANRDKEILYQTTLFGPHRDDFTFKLANKNIALYGSRGEQRSALLALKIAELKYLEEKTQDKPILLLDDIFSELDALRKEKIANVLQEQQSIVTTVDTAAVPQSLLAKSQIICLEDGKHRWDFKKTLFSLRSG